MQLMIKQDCCIKAQTDFIPPLLCPPNSADQNPVHYAVWGIPWDHVYRNQIKDVKEQHQRVKEEWNSLDHRVIDSAVRE